MKWLTKEEARWLRDRVMPRLGIRQMRVDEDHDYRGTYPDIWTDGETVTVTGEWARQTPWERKKRLLHEALHLAGMEHDSRVGFNSRPGRDRFSREMLEAIDAA